MSGKKLDFNSLKKNSYMFALYDKENKKVFGDTIDKEKFFIEDKSPLGHLGIYKIVVQHKGFEKILSSLRQKLFIAFIISYLILAFIGYYLSKLFMKPIKDTRKKLDRFIKDTTHELNTPITAIMMCAKEEALKNPKNIERLYISAKRVSELYKDLTYLFLEDRYKREKRKLQLSHILNEQLKYFEVLAYQKKISLTYKLDDSIAFMDIEDIKRLFSNLISNAIKYNKIGGFVDILLKNSVLTIRDSGIGIEKNRFNQIFDRYFRATSYSGGFGMGLSIVKKIADENGLKIEIESDEQGTVFRIYFDK